MSNDIKSLKQQLRTMQTNTESLDAKIRELTSENNSKDLTIQSLQQSEIDRKKAEAAAKLRGSIVSVRKEDLVTKEEHSELLRVAEARLVEIDELKTSLAKYQ